MEQECYLPKKLLLFVLVMFLPSFIKAWRWQSTKTYFRARYNRTYLRQRNSIFSSSQDSLLQSKKSGNDGNEIFGTLALGSPKSSSSDSRCLVKENDKRIFMPNPQHGYRIVPFSWCELKQICDPTQGDLSLLSRSVTQQYEYELYRRKIKSTWKSVNDHILCSKFGFEQRIDHDNGLKYSYPSLENADVTDARLVVLPNNFPYFVEEKIEHWVLWKLGGVNITPDEIAYGKYKIQAQSQEQAKDFIHWINPPHLKSVPEIDHVHILCLFSADDREPKPGSSKE